MKTLRVLTLDGGGMRGLYSVTYLAALADLAAQQRGVRKLDVGKAFDLIAGTSTGGIIACALAAGVPLEQVANLYRRHGKAIFPTKMPDRRGLALARWLCPARRRLASGAAALGRALDDVFGDMTMRDVHDRRKIALAIPAVEMTRYRGWVFKTPHLPNTHRDDRFRLVDVCLATSAAPIYRSMAAIPHPADPADSHVFVDGGLWANNPVLVGLVDALRMTEPGDRIEVFSLGACPPVGGDVDVADVHRGLRKWLRRKRLIQVTFDAQHYACDNMARMLAAHVDRDCHVARFPHSDPPPDAARYLDLDETSDQGMSTLTRLAHDDINLALSASQKTDTEENKILARLMQDMPLCDPEKPA